MVRESREHLAGLGIDVDPTTRIGSLPIGLQQLIELARVLFSGARIIILDEPTSALSPPEVELLFNTLRRLKEDGKSMIFISHFLDDILNISDSVTIFRNGQKVITESVENIDKQQVIEHMIGAGHRELEESYTGEIELHTPTDAPVVMETDQLSLDRAFHDVSLQVKGGEVLGIYGFMGCGQIELARALFGKIKADSGELRLGGKPIKLTRTSIARSEGIAYVPESRRDMLFHHEPLYKNMSISILDRISKIRLRPGAERDIARRHIDDLRIRTPGPDQLLGNLSGGNQQKVALAKWADPRSPGADPQRTDPGHGCWREGRRGADREEPSRPRDWRCGGFDRTGDGSVARRPHIGDETGGDRSGIRRRYRQ